MKSETRARDLIAGDLNAKAKQQPGTTVALGMGITNDLAPADSTLEPIIRFAVEKLKGVAAKGSSVVIFARQPSEQ